MLRPLRDLLVLKPIHEPGMWGNLWMPDIGMSGNKSNVMCEVIAAGPGWHEKHLEGHKKNIPGATGTWRGAYKARFNPTTVKAGDIVSIPAYGTHLAGEEIEHEGQKLTIIRERDLHGIATK